MLFLRRYEELFFRQTPEGLAFYGGGRFARGYLVDEETAGSLKSFLRKWGYFTTALFLVQILVVQTIFGPMGGLAFAAIYIIPYCVAYYSIVRAKVKHCPRTASRMKNSEMIENQAKIYSRGRVWFLVIVSAIFVLIGTIEVLSTLTNPDGATIAGLLCMGFFGLCLWLGLKISRAQQALRRGF